MALIADGRLILAAADGTSRRHECDFASQIESRQQRTIEKNSWKRADGAEGGMFSRGSLWGGRGGATPEQPRPRILAVEGGDRPDSMVYSLWTGDVGAFLDYDFSEQHERRVFHKESFCVSEFDRHPGHGRLVCRYGDDEVSNLAVLDPDGRNARPITEGDSTDGAPSWIPGTENGVVYHSAGISRDGSGRWCGFGSYGVHRLDLSNGELEMVIEDPQRDFLAPQYDDAGNLHFIRRPYEGPAGKRPSIWVHLKDLVLFPFRLGRAIFDFLQIFSHVVSRKPLTTSGGPKAKGPDPVKLWIHGRMVDTVETGKRGDANGAFAPSDWELVKRTPEGRESVLARHVLAYDLSSDGRILYSDGRNLHLIDEGGKRRVLAEPLTDSVKWIEPHLGVEPA